MNNLSLRIEGNNTITKIRYAKNKNAKDFLMLLKFIITIFSNTKNKQSCKAD